MNRFLALIQRTHRQELRPYCRTMSEEFFISNLKDFIQHLKDSYHIPKQDTQDNGQSLLIESAFENKRKRKTCFLRPKTPHGKDYWPYKKCELLNVVKDTVRFGNKGPPNRKGYIEATHRFNSCIGIHCAFKNGRDERSGFEIKELYSVKVVYIQESSNSIVAVTAFPDYFSDWSGCRAVMEGQRNYILKFS